MWVDDTSWLIRGLIVRLDDRSMTVWFVDWSTYILIGRLVDWWLNRVVDWWIDGNLCHTLILSTWNTKQLHIQEEELLSLRTIMSSIIEYVQTLTSKQYQDNGGENTQAQGSTKNWITMWQPLVCRLIHLYHRIWSTVLLNFCQGGAHTCAPVDTPPSVKRMWVPLLIEAQLLDTAMCNQIARLDTLQLYTHVWCTSYGNQ